jgi:hypothetical protein
MRLPLRWCLAATLAIIALSPAHSQEPTRTAPAKIAPQASSIAQELVGKIKADDSEGLVSVVKSRMHIPKVREEEFGQFHAQLVKDRSSFRDRFGRPLGKVELVRSQVAGESLAYMLLLEKYPKGAVLWHFTFYKGQDGWQLEDVRWNRDFATVFGTAP